MRIALLGLHAFTGCDTVSEFASKGKIRALMIWKAHAEFKEAFAQLVAQWNRPPNLHVKLEEFVCKFHATQPATWNIDALWYNVFCARKGPAESHQIPTSLLSILPQKACHPCQLYIKLQSGEGAK